MPICRIVLLPITLPSSLEGILDSLGADTIAPRTGTRTKGVVREPHAVAGEVGVRTNVCAYVGQQVTVVFERWQCRVVRGRATANVRRYCAPNDGGVDGSNGDDWGCVHVVCERSSARRRILVCTVQVEHKGLSENVRGRWNVARLMLAPAKGDGSVDVARVPGCPDCELRGMPVPRQNELPWLGHENLHLGTGGRGNTRRTVVPPAIIRVVERAWPGEVRRPVVVVLVEVIAQWFHVLRSTGRSDSDCG